MSYRTSWSKTFYNGEFDPHYLGPGYDAPDRCPDHSGGFRCRDDLIPAETAGSWLMKSPISIPSEMPGVNQTILAIGAKSMYDGKKGIGGFVYANLKLFGDGAQIDIADKLTIPRLEWFADERERNLNISDYAELVIRLHQHAVVRLPETFVAIHTAKIWLSGEYYINIPPEKADVTINVWNGETLKPVSGALVKLKIGPVVVARKYTDGGSATFTNINVGSYTMTVTKSGYEPLTDSIGAIAPAAEYNVTLFPIPTPPLPWWAIPLAIGTVGIGAVMVIPAVLKKLRPPIIVVK